MNIALCFCVRNCGSYLNDIYKNIELVKKIKNINVYAIFVYDNCTDNSQQLLEEYQKKIGNSDFTIVRNIDNNSNYRTERVAKARNTCLEIVTNELYDIKFHIMIDCDSVCCTKWNIDVIEKYLYNFDNDDWDCISFNREYYYDIWALLFDDFKHHCWGFGYKSQNVITIMRECIENKLNTCETNSIYVTSAFNGFCIYKTEKFKGLRYDGLYSNIEITEEERLKTVEAFKKYDLDVTIVNTVECCEHIYFHMLALKRGCKIKISKFQVV
jgi:hypothetical protein